MKASAAEALDLARIQKGVLSAEDLELERAIAESEAADAHDEEPDEPDPANEAEDRALLGIYRGNHDMFGRGPYSEGY